ncbi:MAG: aminopeptidase [Sulfobacillus sp.]
MTLSEQDFAAIAEVGVRIGVNLQPGQRLWVNASIAHAPVVRAIAAAAYRAGAKDVTADFHDELLGKIRLSQAPEEGLREFRQWLADGMEEEAKGGTAFLSVVGSDPDLLADVPSDRIAMSMKAHHQAMARFMPYLMGHRAAWSIISAPAPAWAAKVFPGETPDGAMAKLWQAIQQASRVDGPDPIGAWRAHIAQLQARVRWLNDLHIARLSYRSQTTDLEIALPLTHQWVASGQPRAVGYPTSPNIPTEEVFTLPLRDGVNGTVQSTKPLSHAGQLIEDIAVTFQDGRIVSYTASRGLDALREVIETDEGSHFLGEVALVPVDSPISRSGILYYNTLFDENASCHLAIGAAYPTTLTDGGEVEGDADLLKRGANASMTHVDFMIGSADLSIDATTTDGRTVPVFRSGNWAQSL